MTLFLGVIIAGGFLMMLEQSRQVMELKKQVSLREIRITYLKAENYHLKNKHHDILRLRS